MVNFGSSLTEAHLLDDLMTSFFFWERGNQYWWITPGFPWLNFFQSSSQPKNKALEEKSWDCEVVAAISKLFWKKRCFLLERAKKGLLIYQWRERELVFTPHACMCCLSISVRLHVSMYVCVQCTMHVQEEGPNGFLSWKTCYLHEASHKIRLSFFLVFFLYVIVCIWW